MGNSPPGYRLQTERLIFRKEITDFKPEMAVFTDECGIFRIDHQLKLIVMNCVISFEGFSRYSMCGTFRLVFKTRKEGALWELQESGGTNARVQQEEEMGASEVKFWKSVTGCTLGDRKDKEIRKELNM